MRSLIARGYVEQVTDPSDTRAKVIRLTKRGVALRSACLQVRGDLHALAVKELGESNANRLVDDLERLYAALKDSAAPVPRPVRRSKKPSKK